jgi:hypothetical protein
MVFLLELPVQINLMPAQPIKSGQRLGLSTIEVCHPANKYQVENTALEEFSIEKCI